MIPEIQEPAGPPQTASAGEASTLRPLAGAFFALRFTPAVEAEFRSHYRNAFKHRMQTLWTVLTCVWLLATAFDAVVFPMAPPLLRLLRGAGAAILVLAATATFVPVLISRIHALTAVASAAIGICTAISFAALPYPQSLPLFGTLVVLCVVSTIFAATLHYEYSVLASLAILAAFTAVALHTAPVPHADGAGLSVALAAVTAFSLACTNTIEQYARENFAQQVTLERQSVALAEKAQQLAASEAGARDASRAKSVFLSNMSHELRTPLNAVLGFAQLMERDPSLSSEGRENLAIIARSGDHLLALINDVLAISKIEAGRVTLTEQAFDLADMLRSVATMIRVRTEAKALQFLVSTGELPSMVIGDEGKLRQILVNLLGNAVKFTDAGGIALRAEWNGGGILIEIEDTGYGIAGDEIGSLFQAFAQTESGRNSKEGTGLGLAISRNFVRLMGGEIDVESERGRGTTFSVKVPLRIGEDGQPRVTPREVRALLPGQPAFRVLIVDDSRDNRLLLRRLLEPVGFALREAANGQEAIDAWREWQPQLIWMDIRMPVLDGYEATRRIRELAHGAPCKIVALTASAFQHDRERILVSGCDDFVSKPFRAPTIFDKLREHLGAEFLYDTPDQPTEPRSAAASAGALDPERLRRMPQDTLAKLKAAMLSCDLEAASDAIAQIQERDAGLGVELSRLVRSFRFDDVLDALG